MVRRFIVLTALIGLLIALIPGAASASVDGDCTGEATIKGVTYTPANDTPSKAIPIPDEAGVEVKYSGSVDFENKNHSGSAKVQVGPFSITLGKPWSGSNEADTRGVTDQTYQLDDFRDKLPIWIPGVWKVSAEHSASGGSCKGFAMVKLEGNALGNPVGIVALVLLLALLYLAIRSVIGGRVISAALAALFLGFFLGLLLMMFAVRPLDTLSVIVIPVVLALIAGGIALTRGRSAMSRIG
jgi:hypothetical protein